ncbi:MAG: phosphoribosyltransferase, partial [Acidimicrobiales bacterium]
MKGPNHPVLFGDRAEAGRLLAQALRGLSPSDALVLGLPRGGVAVGAEVALGLGLPLDVLVVRKIGVPSQPELAMGALGEGGVLVVDERVRTSTGIDPQAFDEVRAAEQSELDRRAALYRRGRAPASLERRTVILVDDGVATGSSARAACEVARASGAHRVILAVPVGPKGIEEDFAGLADEVVCLSRPAALFAIGEAYSDFSAVDDHQVVELLER